MKKGKRNKLAIVVLSTFLSIIVIGCGNSSGGMSQDASYDTASQAPLYNESVGATADYGVMPEASVDKTSSESMDTTSSAPINENTSVAANRKLIKSVSLSLETTSYDEFIIDLEAIIKEGGGYVEYSYANNGNSYYVDSALHNAQYTVRIPVVFLDTFVNEIGNMANQTSKQENVEDVTLNYVDMESHKEMLRIEQQNLLDLLARAETVEDNITIESRLSEVRYQIESLESQLRTYDNLIDFATVTLSIQEVERLTPASEKTTWEEIQTGFSENLYRVGQGFKRAGVSILVNSPILLTVILFSGLVCFIIIISIKVSNKKRAKRQAKYMQSQISNQQSNQQSYQQNNQQNNQQSNQQSNQQNK